MQSPGPKITLPLASIFQLGITAPLKLRVSPLMGETTARLKQTH